MTNHRSLADSYLYALSIKDLDELRDEAGNPLDQVCDINLAIAYVAGRANLSHILPRHYEHLIFSSLHDLQAFARQWEGLSRVGVRIRRCPLPMK